MGDGGNRRATVCGLQCPRLWPAIAAAEFLPLAAYTHMASYVLAPVIFVLLLRAGQPGQRAPLVLGATATALMLAHLGLHLAWLRNHALEDRTWFHTASEWTNQIGLLLLVLAVAVAAVARRRRPPTPAVAATA